MYWWIAGAFLTGSWALGDVPCSLLTSEAVCSGKYCCWRDAQCFAPSEVAGMECPLVTDPTACKEVWGSNCKWENGLCQRLPMADAIGTCNRVFAGHEATRRNLEYALFDSPVLKLKPNARYTALNSNRQYCFSKSTQSACRFPFTYQGVEYRDCVMVAGKMNAQCMTTGKRKQLKLAGCHCLAKRRPRSVVMITLDDFRPEMNVAYSRKAAFTPVMDQFAKRPGTVIMDRAYVQIALCSPSRDSYLSGLLPDTTRSYTLTGRALRDHPNREQMTTLPQLFKQAGYYTAGGGKIFHLHKDDPLSWNEYYSRNVNQNTACLANNKQKIKFKLLDGSTTTLGCSTDNYESILDTAVTTKAIETLERIVHQAKEPFFLAVGLFKPHLPYHVHSAFWDRFASPLAAPEYEDMDDMGAPAPESSFVGNLTFNFGASEAGKNWGHDPFGDKSNAKSKVFFRSLMRRGYQAAVYQTDDMIGQVLNKIELLGLGPTTLVIIHGDHGFALGEGNVFAKQTNFEIAVRVPVLIHVPWYRELGSFQVETTELRRNPEFFELLDLLPTVAGIMQVGKPTTRYEGMDQSGQIAVAAMESQPRALPNARAAAFSQIMRCVDNDCSTLKSIYAMGYSVRTVEWRYSVFLPAPHGVAQWDLASALSQELYTHRNDAETLLAYATGALYGQVEMTNLAQDNPQVCLALYKLLVSKYVNAWEGEM
ncbi:hypothetical protein BASA81_002166 [Batrachochytrium salamandrivorans]|nr:hypothetical protein BASA81_002166 [Batrachochytrium salamandrivorans]